MSFALDDDQQLFRDSIRDFLTACAPESSVRRLMGTEPGYDAALWSRMATELGLQGLAIPERFGGSGFGPVEVGIALEEVGRALLCAPYLGTVALAVPLLLLSEDEAACRDYLPRIASGELVATVAIAEPGGGWDADGVATRAGRTGHGWRLDGIKSYVLDGCAADVVLVLARTDSGMRVFAVDGTAAGLVRTRLTSLDTTRPLARLEFHGTPARPVGADGPGWQNIEAALQFATAGLAMEAVGGAQRCLDMTVDYVRIREQFGQPIGSFQAIKHRCADLLVGVESARAAAYHAVRAIANVSHEADEAALMASLAKAYCTDVYFATAAETIQLHGGIGFTWEHPAHLYFRRAKSSQLLFGDTTVHHELIARRIGLSA
jgi:alkylation response protein AidB-like acyl-CoA dehydrogenase